MGSSAFEPLFFGSGGSMFSMARVYVILLVIQAYHNSIGVQLQNVLMNQKMRIWHCKSL
jgi:hypothetical protein